MKEKDKKSTVSWIMEFAGTNKNKYVVSIITAICGVVCGIVLLFAFWLCRVAFHGISTSLSHTATFTVLGNRY